MMIVIILNSINYNIPFGKSSFFVLGQPPWRNKPISMQCQCNVNHKWTVGCPKRNSCLPFCILFNPWVHNSFPFLSCVKEVNAMMMRCYNNDDDDDDDDDDYDDADDSNNNMKKKKKGKKKKEERRRRRRRRRKLW